VLSFLKEEGGVFDESESWFLRTFLGFLAWKIRRKRLMLSFLDGQEKLAFKESKRALSVLQEIPLAKSFLEENNLRSVA
jgi:hypothetical protein